MKHQEAFSAPLVAGYFVDAQGWLEKLTAMVREPDLPADVVHLFGHGGLGKTSLLAMFAWSCRCSGILAAQVHAAEENDLPGLLEKFAREFKLLGSAMPAFWKSWKEYQSNQKKEVSAAEHNRGAAATTIKQAGGVAEDVIKVAGDVANITPLAKAKDVVKLGVDIAGIFRGTLWQDIELQINAVQRLSEQFCKDLEKLTENGRVVLLLDTYEQLSRDDEWVRKWSAALPANVLLVIAGRHDPREAWRDDTGMKRIWFGDLQPMSEDQIVTLVQRHFKWRGARLPEGARRESPSSPTVFLFTLFSMRKHRSPIRNGVSQRSAGVSRQAYFDFCGAGSLVPWKKRSTWPARFVGSTGRLSGT
jgi:hypothetical protein